MKNNPAFQLTIHECSLIGLHLLLESFGSRHAGLRLCAMRALSLLKDLGVDGKESLEKLHFFQKIVSNPSLEKTAKLNAFSALHPRLQEFFQFLIWASLEKIERERFGERTIETDPDVLHYIKNFENKSIVEQVYDQFFLSNRLGEVQRLLIALKLELMLTKKNPQKIAFLLKSLQEHSSAEFIFLPLVKKISSLIDLPSSDQRQSKDIWNIPYI